MNATLDTNQNIYNYWETLFFFVLFVYETTCSVNESYEPHGTSNVKCFTTLSTKKVLTKLHFEILFLKFIIAF